MANPTQGETLDVPSALPECLHHSNILSFQTVSMYRRYCDAHIKPYPAALYPVCRSLQQQQLAGTRVCDRTYVTFNSSKTPSCLQGCVLKVVARQSGAGSVVGEWGC